MSAAMERPHSGFGIASFIVSLAVGLLLVVLVVIAGVLEAATPGGMDENSASAVAVGLLMIAGVIGEIVAASIGIAGLLQQDRRKTFAVLGLVFSLLSLFGLAVLMVLGLMAG